MSEPLGPDLETRVACLERSVRRWKTVALGMLAVLAVSVMAALVLAISLQVRAHQAMREAEAARNRAEQAQYEALVQRQRAEQQFDEARQRVKEVGQK